MATMRGRERARSQVARLARRGLTVDGFVSAATGELRKVVPFDGVCLVTTDPATLLPTGEVVQGGLPGEVLPRLNEIELREPDINKFVALARGPRQAAGLGEATEGDLDRSLRQRELRRPSGFEDELRAVLPGPTGVWGALTLLRELGTPHFTAAEVETVGELVAPLADGVRRAIMLDEFTAAGADDQGLGLVVLAADGAVESADRAGQRWLDELGATGDEAGRLPPVVHAVATRARADDGGAVTARVRTATGRWLVARGSLLGDGGARVAVLLEPLRAPELAPLIADTYGFTQRERRITELVAQGFSTSEIADRLHLSAYTVQDHLKSVFEKSGTGSRGELVAALFFRHYLPRLQ